jgi:hypothetical protein
MQVENYMQLGLPVLEAQLKVIKTTLDKVFKVARTKKVSARIDITIEPDLGGTNRSTFHFPAPDFIPQELQQFLNDWSTRLIGERWIIEQAIEQLRELHENEAV